jgi:membrane-bound lytic murein transglycosylase D
MDIRLAAKLADTPLDEFMSLNAGYSRPVIRAVGEQTLLVPMEKAEIFRANLQNHDEPLVSWQAYQLKSGETLDKIAARHKVTVAYLSQVNDITPKRKIGPGSTVLVPTGANASPNLPDLPAPPVAVANPPKKAVKNTRGTMKHKAPPPKTTAARGKVVVAHTAR